MRDLRRIVPGILAVAAIGLSSACSSTDEPGPSGSTEVDVVPGDCGAIKGWAFVSAKVLPSCKGSTCHDPGNNQALVVLAPDTAYQSTVGVVSTALPTMKLVEPGRPSRSFFYRKLVATQAAACEGDGVAASTCGAKMPLNDWFGLPDEYVEETRAWIACGAKP